MISCAPKGHQIALTTKALTHLLNLPPDTFALEAEELNTIWVHWPSVLKAFQDDKLRDSIAAQRLMNLWNAGAILEIPWLFCDAELPAIASLNDKPGMEDNVSVYCETFGEYAELRKTYGEEDVKFFRRI